ncbi:MAG: hypothetical protein ACP5JC_03890 [Candidatus Micrarchaeia archaeon]
MARVQMSNGRLKYEEVRAYASNGPSRLSAKERHKTFPRAYGLIEELRETYNKSKSNGNGLDKLNGVFEAKL